MDSDEFTSSWTFILTCIVSLYGLVSVFIDILIVLVLFREKSYSQNSFFTIYKVILLTDILSVLSSNIFAVVPSLGFLNELYSSHEILVHCVPFFAHLTRALEGGCNTLMCLNRATAIIKPFEHKKIWKWSKLSAMLSFNFVISISLGYLSTLYNAHWQKYPGNRMFMVHDKTSGVRYSWIAGFISMLFTVILICTFYVVILVKFQEQLKKYRSISISNRSTRKVENKQAISLLYVAFSVVSIEIVSLCYFFYYYIAIDMWEEDLRVFYVRFFAISYLYSTMPAYLLILFCSTIRQDIRKLCRSINTVADLFSCTSQSAPKPEGSAEIFTIM